MKALQCFKCRCTPHPLHSSLYLVVSVVQARTTSAKFDHHGQAMVCCGCTSCRGPANIIVDDENDIITYPSTYFCHFHSVLPRRCRSTTPTCAFPSQSRSPAPWTPPKLVTLDDSLKQSRVSFCRKPARPCMPACGFGTSKAAWRGWPRSPLGCAEFLEINHGECKKVAMHVAGILSDGWVARVRVAQRGMWNLIQHADSTANATGEDDITYGK